MSIELRKISEKAELEELAALADAIWHEFFPSIISVEQIDYMLEKFLSIKALLEEQEEGYEMYMTESDGETVGFCVIRPDVEDDRMFLSKIYLMKETRGKGCSSKVLDILEDITREHGLHKMWLTVNKHNDTAIPVYEHRGFEIIEEAETDIGGGFVMDDYIMEHVLD